MRRLVGGLGEFVFLFSEFALAGWVYFYILDSGPLLAVCSCVSGWFVRCLSEDARRWRDGGM